MPLKQTAAAECRRNTASPVLRPTLCALALLAAVSGCARAGNAGTAKPARDVLRLTVQSDPATLNPLLQTVSTEGDLATLAFDTLLDADGQNRLVPRLATTVPTIANGGISHDGKTVVFHLNSKATWQDNVPLTSRDVAYTVRAILDPRHNVTNRSGYDRVERTETPDAHTVVFHLKSPYAPFIATVGYGYPIVPEHLLAHSADFNHDPFNAHPVGSGPYRFMRWNRGDDLTYEANAHYFGGPPAVPKIHVSIVTDENTLAILLRQHQVDFARVESSVFGQLRGTSGLTTKLEPNNSFVAYVFNTTSPILRDPRVRHAFAKALNRASIVQKNTYGTGTVAWADLPAVLWTKTFPPNPDAFDPAAAAALLDEAGWKPGPDGIRRKNGTALSLRAIDYAGSTTGRNEDVQVQAMMRKVGMDLTLSYFSTSLYYKREGPLDAGRFDIATLTFIGGIDPQNDELYTCGNRAPGGMNSSRYCSREMDALQAASLRELDPEKRRAEVAAIERLAVRDAPYVFTYYTSWRVVQDPALRRPVAGLTQPWYDVAHWNFEE